MKHILLFSMFISLAACNNKPVENAQVKAAATTTAPGDFAWGNQSLADAIQQMNQDFQKGNMEAWLQRYSDDAVFLFSSGDTMTGKNAIAQYWNERRLRVIDTIEMTNEVLMPVNLRNPQGQYSSGNWLMNWYQVDVRFQNKEKLRFWVHVDHHFNNAGLIDRSIQYMDFVPIKNALQKPSGSR
jgi:hypothetical protein